jgi:hypothetical protein
LAQYPLRLASVCPTCRPLLASRQGAARRIWFARSVNCTKSTSLLSPPLL